uniref:BTB domain-containing protein n=1 Tax=Panagrolaimus sp. ES5 TaxID=591445 RepID=A0AC34GVT6_9BILA
MSDYFKEIEDTPKLYTVRKEFVVDKGFFKLGGSYELIHQTVDGMPNVGWKFRIASQTTPIFGCQNRFYWELFLHVFTNTTIKYKVNFEVTSKNDSVCEEFNGVMNTYKKIGNDKFIMQSDLMSKFLGDYELTIFVKAEFSYTSNQDQRIFGEKPMMQNKFWPIRLQSHGEKDFKFIVGNEAIQIHKFLLTLESEVFAAVLENNNFKEAQTGEIEIQDFKPVIVKAFVVFCYGADISGFMKYTHDAMELLKFADKYDMKNLKVSIEEYYRAKLTKANVAIVLSAANKYNAPELKMMCMKYIQSLPTSEKVDIACSGLNGELRGLFI